MIEDNAPHILIIDDDTRIRKLLSRFLQEDGFRVSVSESATQAHRQLEGLDFDLLVVDVMMPGETGLEFTRTLRASQKDVPVIMLTALSETDHRIEGLTAGADDYLPKPFDPRELVLRINAILRRREQAEPLAVEQIVFGPYVFHLSRCELKKNGELLRLTDKERAMMSIFAERAGQTVPRHELSGDELDVGERTIDVQINRLRRKIESDPANPLWLQTVRGIGYRLLVD